MLLVIVTRTHSMLVWMEQQKEPLFVKRIYAGVGSISNSCMELYNDADPTTETTFGWSLQVRI